jgi:peptide/nickel transport system substrate-binding protein
MQIKLITNRGWALLLGSLLLLSSANAAVLLRIGNQGDIIDMDPYSVNESLHYNVLSNVYEPLIARDENFKLTPALATSWNMVEPTRWRFNLRKGVRFHDGTPFTADDVIFSYERVKQEGSDMASFVASIKSVQKIDDNTIDFVLYEPFPILPETLSRWLIMGKKWCEANGAAKPVNRVKGTTNAAATRSNGTGPYQLLARQANMQTSFQRNPNYWAPIAGNVDNVIYKPISNAEHRVAALVSGAIDVMEPLPLKDLAQVRANPKLKAVQGPEARVIMLGMDQSRDELLYASVKGKNPFKDLRVRQAFYQAIDVDALRKNVMRGASLPTGMMIASHVNGYAPELEKRLPYDVQEAKSLMAQAGYASGFELKMNCPNDRYVNDAEICRHIARNLLQIGVKVSIELESKSSFMPKLSGRNTSFYLIGLNVTTVDVHQIMFLAMASPSENGQGNFNFGGYSNPKFDTLTQQIGAESQPALRNAMIYEALKIHQDEIGHIPLHRQALTWGVKESIDVVQWPDNGMPWRYIKVSQ